MTTAANAACRQEDLWAPVIACCDAPSVLEPGEAVLDLVALAV